MAKGTQIILSPEPRGEFIEGIIGDTSKPGSCMMIQAGTAPVGGRHTWVQATAPSDGAPIAPVILLADELQGKLSTDAYVNGTRCFLYLPAPGEDMNVLLTEGAGPNTVTIGDKFMIDADGKNFIPLSGSPGSVPFQAMETIVLTAPNIPGLVWVKYTGQ